jgi:hypothetical protein
MKQFIISQGFADTRDRMRVLMDDGKSEMPTGKNMMEAMQWLVADARPGDALFLHYSGHGSEQADTNGDEKSGMDQVLVPVDYNTGGRMIVDDWVLQTLVLPLPENVHMFAVMDCCHSGSIMDLPYEITVTPELIAQVEAANKLQPAEAEQSLQQLSTKPNPSYLKKYKKLLGGAAGGAAAGAAVGLCLGGPIGACMGAVVGGCLVACGLQDQSAEFAADVYADVTGGATGTQNAPQQSKGIPEQIRIPEPAPMQPMPYPGLQPIHTLPISPSMYPPPMGYSMSYPQMGAMPMGGMPGSLGFSGLPMGGMPMYR